MDREKPNGSFNICRAENSNAMLVNVIEQYRKIEVHMNTQIVQYKNEAEWMKKYIDRTMPIRSHYAILFGSLSILAGFAAILRYIDMVAK